MPAAAVDVLRFNAGNAFSIIEGFGPAFTTQPSPPQSSPRPR